MTKTKKANKITVFRIVALLVLLLAAVIVAYPLFLALKKSFTDYGFWNYVNVLHKVSILRNLLNSIIVVGLTLIGTIICCSLAAFAFAKLRFRGKNVLFLFLMMGMMIPTSATIFPLFQIIKVLGLVNNPISQVPAYITGNAIFGLLLLKSYYDGLPDEMMEAARIDGANSLQIFMKVMLPVSIPGLSVLIVNTFMGAWNELQIAITFINKREYMTMAAIPVQFAGSMGGKEYVPGELFACLILCMLPVVIVYISAQKMIINGMTAGAVKG